MAYTVEQIVEALLAVQGGQVDAATRENVPAALREVIDSLDITATTALMLAYSPALAVCEALHKGGIAVGWQARQRLLDVEELEALHAGGGSKVGG